MSKHPLSDGSQSEHLLNGKSVAENLFKATEQRLLNWRSLNHSKPPTLRILRVGENQASALYVRNKILLAQRLGMHAYEHHVGQNTPFDELATLIDSWNDDVATHGIVVQMPLPEGLQRHTDDLLSRVNPKKDVDGIHPNNLGNLIVNNGAGFIPCTPQGILRLLKHYNIPLASKAALVIGRSRIVGIPTAALLTHANATVTIAHSKTLDLPLLCRNAEILVVAAGIPGLVSGDWIQDGACVIDVGIHRTENDKWIGDVKSHELKGRKILHSPVPGGVGPLTVACLMHNTAEAFAQQEDVP